MSAGCLRCSAENASRSDVFRRLFEPILVLCEDRKKENGIADDRQHLGYVDADCLLRAYQEQE